MPEVVDIPPDALPPRAKRARKKPKGKAKSDAKGETPRVSLDEPSPLEVDVSSKDEIRPRRILGPRRKV